MENKKKINEMSESEVREFIDDLNKYMSDRVTDKITARTIISLFLAYLDYNLSEEYSEQVKKSGNSVLYG